MSKRELPQSSKPQSSKLKSHDNLAFQEGHVLKFGLEITQRDQRTLKVGSVRCRFCSIFGREGIIGQQRDHKQTENVKNWTVFRKEYYRLLKGKSLMFLETFVEELQRYFQILRLLSPTFQFLVGRRMNIENH